MIEVWKQIPGFETFYEVSNLGRVKSCARAVSCCYGAVRNIKDCILKGSKDRDGYLLVSLTNATQINVSKRVHQLVLLAFKGGCPDGMQSLHDNGIPDDNKLSNLYYGTPLQNWADRRRHGKDVNGNNNPNSRNYKKGQ